MTSDSPLTDVPAQEPPRFSRSVVLRVVLLCLAAVLSLWVTKLALFAAVGTLLGFVSLPARPERSARFAKLGLLIAGTCALIGTFRFLMLEAVPGMVEGGTTATEQRAVSRLREILFAEDAWRKNAFHDPDTDRVGSAGLLGELTGEVGVRSGQKLSAAVLQNYPALVETRIGPAANVNGYLVIVCLPKRGGGYTAVPGEAVDDERAEREYFAYAWPAERGQGLTLAYSLDEHERILRADSRESGQARLLGPDAPPACDDVTAASSARDWRVWRKKQPRATLPYDTQ